MPSTNANNATWYILRYARDFTPDPPDPLVRPWRRPVLGPELFYDDPRHVLELRPVAPAAGTEAEPLRGIAVSPEGEVYLSDPERGTVLVRRCDGRECELPCERDVFARPAGLSLDRRGLLFVADPAARRVVALSTADGSVAAVIAGGLQEPVDVAASPDGLLYVADRATGEIVVYGPRLAAPLRRFATRGPEGLPAAPRPIAVAVEADGAIVVADAAHPRLLRFGPEGQPLAEVPLHGGIPAGDVVLEVLRSTQGLRAPREVAGMCGPCAPEDDLGKRLAALHLALRRILLRLAQTFEPCGAFVSAALDGGRPGVPWHKIEIDADVPPGTWLKIQTVTADDPELLADPSALPAPLEFQPFEDVSTCAAKPAMPFEGARGVPEGARTWGPVPDRLIFSPPGRWLRLRLVLGSDGSATPTVRSIRIFHPRVSYLDLLPGVFRRDPAAGQFLERFLALFEHVLTGIEDRYEAFSRELNPDAAPREVIDWLACLVDLAFDPSWPLEKRRALVASAMELYRIRGTPEGIARYVEVYTGVRPVIVEHFLTRPERPPHVGARGGVLGCDTALARAWSASRTGLDAWAHRFDVIVFSDDSCEEPALLAVVDQIVTVNKPAHTLHRLRIANAETTRVGDVHVGMDVVLAGREPAKTPLAGCALPAVPPGVLGTTAVLAPSRAALGRRLE